MESTLKTARIALDMTQQEVAEKLGISTTTYSEYEDGSHQIPIGKIKSLSEILDIKESVLTEAYWNYFSAPTKSKSTKAIEQDEASDGHSPKANAVAKAYDQAPTAIQSSVCKLLDIPDDEN